MQELKKAIFIDPLSDYGFKRTFGPQSDSEALKDFLNALLKLDNPIVEITYISSEQLGENEDDRKSVFDIHCKDGEGNYFIIEVQKLREDFFKDRSVFYSTFPIRNQGRRGKWNFQLKRTYTICILDFCFDDSHPDYTVHEVMLTDLNTREIFYDRLTYIYVELPKFKKSENELITREDKWLYILKHLTGLEQIPLSLADDPVFKQYFMDAEQAMLAEKQLEAYYARKKAEWDEYAIRETAIREGKEQGIAEGRVEGKAEGKVEGRIEAIEAVVISLLQHTPYSIEEIAGLVNIPVDAVVKIREDKSRI